MIKITQIICFFCFCTCGTSLLAQQSTDTIVNKVVVDSCVKNKYVRIFTQQWEPFHKIEVNGNYCYKILQDDAVIRDSLVAYFTEEEKQSFGIDVKDSTLFITSNYRSDVIDSLGLGEKSDTIYIVAKTMTDIFAFGNATICANLAGNDSSQYNIKIQGVSEYKGSITGGNVNVSIADASVVWADFYIENLKVTMTNACEMYATGYAGRSLFSLHDHCLLDIVNLEMSNVHLHMSNKSQTLMKNKIVVADEAQPHIEKKISSDSELLFK